MFPNVPSVPSTNRFQVMAVLKQKQLQLAAVEAEVKVIQIELEDKNRQLKVRLPSIRIDGCS